MVELPKSYNEVVSGIKEPLNPAVTVTTSATLSPMVIFPPSVILPSIIALPERVKLLAVILPFRLREPVILP